MPALYSPAPCSDPAPGTGPAPSPGHTPSIGHTPSRQRLVRRDGSGDVVFRHVPAEWLLLVTDIFTTLMEIRWRVMFLLFALSYILSWTFFGVLFWVVAIANGDVQNHNSEPCVYEVRSFTAAFLFSLETQTTIGYGFRGMSENCLSAIVLVTVQDVMSCFIDTFVIGIVVAKMASARKRAQTVGFSHCAVINLRDGALCLSWRVGDFRRHHLVEGTARAQLVHSTVHSTGKVEVRYTDLVLQQNTVILATPSLITHRIVPGSPLYNMSLADLRSGEDFELVVTFTYTDDTTGILHQTRTAYTPTDVHWGELFQEMIRVTRRGYRVDYSLFHSTARVLVPIVSAAEYEQKKQLKLNSPRHSPRSSPRNSPRPQAPLSDRDVNQNRTSDLLKPPSVTVELADGDLPHRSHI
ncbi:unnamed protein product [Knipowitschia caucasica]|uniref:Uncharacterized protein n=1 Tax=Knipowitschia caucasica TaxID=637954 RepID=A0AAV2LDF4_KNICA